MEQSHSEEINPEKLQEQIAHQVEEFQKSSAGHKKVDRPDPEADTAAGLEVDEKLLKQLQDTNKDKFNKKRQTNGQTGR